MFMSTVLHSRHMTRVLDLKMSSTYLYQSPLATRTISSIMISCLTVFGELAISPSTTSIAKRQPFLSSLTREETPLAADMLLTSVINTVAVMYSGTFFGTKTCPSLSRIICSQEGLRGRLWETQQSHTPSMVRWLLSAFTAHYTPSRKSSHPVSPIMQPMVLYLHQLSDGIRLALKHY